MKKFASSLIPLITFLFALVAAFSIVQPVRAQTSPDQPIVEPGNPAFMIPIRDLRKKILANHQPDLSQTLVVTPPPVPVSSTQSSSFSPLTTIGPIIRMTTDPTAQNEPAIDINPNNTAQLVATANDYRSTQTLDTQCGFYFSTDSGSTWPTQMILLPNPSIMNAAGDPSVGYDGSGNAYLGCLAFNRTTSASGVYLYKRTSGGQLSAPFKIAENYDSNTANDKPYIAVDKNSSMIYVTWTQFQNSGAITTIYLASVQNTPNGLSLVKIRRVNQPSNTSNQFSQPAVAPNGLVYAVWDDYQNNRIATNRTSDGGDTWYGDKGIKNNIGWLPSPLPGVTFNADTYPSAAVSRSNSNHLYVAWSEWNGTDAEIRFRDCFFSTSYSCGSVITVNYPPRYDQFMQWLSVSPNNSVNISYFSRIDSTTEKMNEIFAYSTDSGNTYTLTQVTSTPINQNQGWGDFIGDYSGITSLNGLAYPMWTGATLDNGQNNQDVYTDHITIP